jgi:Zn-dependent protease with chaperone function
VPYCKCGTFFKEGAAAYCVKCGFETWPRSRGSDSSGDADRNADPAFLGDEALRSPGENAALLTGLGLFAVTWLVFDVATDAIPLLLISVGLIVYALYQQGVMKGSGIPVGQRSFPDVDLLAQRAADRLGIGKPNLFIRHSNELNAHALGFPGSSFVVLNSAAVNALHHAPEELQFIIGHEFTHIRCAHVMWLTVAARNPILGRVPVLNVVLPLFFGWWSRQAEYTADRGGLIACGSLAASQRALARLVVGSELFDRLEMDEFVKQAQDDVSTRASELFSSHPPLTKRIRALAEFAATPLGIRAQQANKGND